MAEGFGRLPKQVSLTGSNWIITELRFQDTPREIGLQIYTLKEKKKLENACDEGIRKSEELWAELFFKKEEERVQEDFFN